MKSVNLGVALVLALGGPTAVQAAETLVELADTMQSAKKSEAFLALAELKPSAHRVDLASSAFSQNSKIPKKYSAYSDNMSPPLSWSAVPDAKSYVLILEDPDAPMSRPFVHWLAWNIPSSVTRLPEGLPSEPSLADPEGMTQGKTTRGAIGYFGPRPPEGDAAHHYHFQILALDRVLEVAPGSDRDKLMQAVKGHVIAAGELIGLFAKPT